MLKIIHAASAGARELEPPPNTTEALCLIYNGGLGAPSGVQGQSLWSRGQGAKLPWSWELFSIGMSDESGKIGRFDCIWLTALCAFMNVIQWRS